MLPVIIVLAVLLGVILFIGLILLGIYNGLVRSRVRCREAWAGIDVQLKRRASLIPNLVETVKGYAAHEREVLENVTRPPPPGEGKTPPSPRQFYNRNTMDFNQRIEVVPNVVIANMFNFAPFEFFE